MKQNTIGTLKQIKSIPPWYALISGMWHCLWRKQYPQDQHARINKSMCDIAACG